MNLPCAILGFAHDKDDVQAYIDAATRLAVHQRRKGRAPSLYRSGVRYARERHTTLPGVERIQTPEETNAMGRGDCDDLAPWLAADYIIAGIPARAVVIESPGIGFHVVVARRDDDGRIVIEDPSARLGMLEVGSRRSRRRARLRALATKAKGALKRAADLVTSAGSETGRAKLSLLREAARLTRTARVAARAAEEAETEPDDEASEDA